LLYHCSELGEGIKLSVNDIDIKIEERALMSFSENEVSWNRLTDSHHACSHTDIGDEPSWWAVDLGAIYDISNVVIFGRADCCPERLSNFEIEVFRPCRNKTSWFDDSIVTLCHHQKEQITHLDATCPEQTVGKYVRIRLKDRNYLALCEVEVHGTFVENVYS
ncbi:coagulation protein factor 5 8 type domain-containing, partial [Mytilus galloprovincialis]